METDNELIKRKVEYYYKTNRKVHITLNNKAVRNGIIKNTSALLFILDDKVNGEIPIFFQEVYDVEPYKEER
jgi:hypothetical protein